MALRAIVIAVVERRADVEVRNPHGATTLMNACACGNWSCVRVLLDAHADPHATNTNGHNAMGVTPRDQTNDTQGHERVTSLLSRGIAIW